MEQVQGVVELPFLPGNTFTDPTKNRFHRGQTLTYSRGYALPIRPTVAIGGQPLEYNQLSEADLDELANTRPTLTYGSSSRPAPVGFIPAHVAFDKKVLCFNAYLKQTVNESPQEYYRVRRVKIYYYLEDDSISVVEPPIENSGIPQGKLIKRHRLPKNDMGDFWHWMDINIGMDVCFYGKFFHVYDSDGWTREYMASEGIELDHPEPCPTDPYTVNRIEPINTFKTPSIDDKLMKFLKLDRHVLRFFCVWDDRDQMFGDLRPYILHYFLVDDTIEVREVHQPNDGRDPFPVLLCRQRVPYDRTDIPLSFPTSVMETSEDEIKDYIAPSNLGIGNTINVMGRRFFIYDCDGFTRRYYNQELGVELANAISVSKPLAQPQPQEFPPYNGFGSLDDSKQSCLSLIPQPPKKDVIKMLENDGKILRYAAKLDSAESVDQGRRFIISFWLSNDTISIYEPQQRNSGVQGGLFLERTQIAKPNSPVDDPDYYKPWDFVIGGSIDVLCRRFIITDADDYVLKHIESNPHQFPTELMEKWREFKAKKTKEEEQ